MAGLRAFLACALVAALVHQATAAQSVGPPRQNSGRRLAADPLGGGPLFWRVAGLVVQGVECEGEGGAAACPPADAIRDVVLGKVANITILSVGASKRAAPAWAGSDLSTIFCGPGYEACLPSWPRGAAEEEELWRRVTHLPSCPLAGGNQLTLRFRLNGVEAVAQGAADAADAEALPALLVDARVVSQKVLAELDEEAGQKLLVVVGNTTPAPRSEEGQCLAEAPAPAPAPEA